MVGLLLLFFLTAPRMSSAQELTVARSLADVWESFGDLAGSLYTVRISPQQGRGDKSASLILPLLLGFKAGGAIMSAMTALKLLILKTLALSKLALLASLALAAKLLWDKLQKPIYDVTPYHYAEVVNWEPTYEVHSESHAVQEPSADQQGHFSHPVVQSVNNTAFTYGAAAPVAQTSQRKHFRVSRPLYKTTVYKSSYRVK